MIIPYRTRQTLLRIGIILLIVVMWLSKAFNFTIVSWLLGKTMELGIITIIILFQPEIRNFLTTTGSSLGNVFERKAGREQIDSVLEATVSACTQLSKTRTGALIVFQRNVQLEEYMKSHPDMEFYDAYADNAFIGLLFERPEFMRMMKDIIAGKINCIIVKDLSYFSRNYMDFEIYLNRITTKYKVRFIALNNEVDTIKDVTYKYAFAN